MKIRTQFIVAMLLFGIALIVISASGIITSQQVGQANAQLTLANRIAEGANGLGYLSSDYLIYREAQQFDRWRKRFAEFYIDVSLLSVDKPEQQTLVDNIQINSRRLKEVFDSIASSVSTQNQTYIDPVFLQISWSRMAVQTQGLVSDSSRLAQLLHDQADQAQKTHTNVIIALVVILAMYFLINYLIIQRRALKSIAVLQAGTEVIGSGNLDFKIREKSNDEIGDLAHAFNRMTANLKEVTASKSDLEKEITRRSEVEEELRVSNEQLQENTQKLEEEISERKEAEEALKKSEETFRIVPNFTYDMEHWRGQDNRFVYISPSCWRITGYSDTEFMQNPDLYFNIVHPDDRGRVETHVRGNQNSLETCEMEFRITRRDGQERWISHVCQAVVDTQGNPLGRRASDRDITERKEIEEALRISEKRYRTYVEVTGELGWTTNVNGEVVEDTPSFRRFTGQSYEEVKGWGWSNALHPDDLERTKHVWRKAVQERSKYEVEYRLRRYDGVYRYFLALGVPVPRDDGDIVEWVGTCIDITERKEAEVALKESESRFRSLFSSMTDGVCEHEVVYDASGKPVDYIITGANTAYETITGLSSMKALQMKASTLYGSDPPPYLDIYSKVAETGKPYIFETCYPPMSRHFHISVFSPGRGKFVTISSDISDRKQLEETLRRTNEELEARVQQRTAEVTNERQRLYNVLEMLPAYVVLLDKDYHVPFANKFFRDRFGESHGKRCYEYLFNRSESCENCESYKVMNTKAPHHWEWLGPDGKNYDIYDYPFKDTDGSLMIMEMGIDITVQKRAQEALLKAYDELETRVQERTTELREEISERKKAEAALSATAAELAAIHANIPIALMLVDRERRVQKVNQAAAEFSGRQMDEMVGLRGGEALRCLHSLDDPQGCGFGPSCKTCLIRQAVHDTFEKRKPQINVEAKFPLNCDGRVEERWLQISTALLSSDSKETVLLCAEDITERKKVEQLKDEFISLVSHELRTPLTIIIGSLRTAMSPGVSKEDADLLIQNSAESADELAAILENMLELSRYQAGRLHLNVESLAIADTANKVIEKLKARGVTQRIVTDLNSLPRVKADSVRLERILYNFIENSTKYSPEDSEIKVSAHTEGNMVVTEVTDHGDGISKDDQSQLFELFRRLPTSRTAKGAGLGLVVCKRLAEAQGGWVKVASTPGKGSTFSFALPTNKSS
ncbi:MAG: PAS domain S-box protein [Chloroflexota bacterium]